MQPFRMSIVIHCLPAASVTTGGAIGNLSISKLPHAQIAYKRMGACQQLSERAGGTNDPTQQ
jgi:hypothetical protein